MASYSAHSGPTRQISGHSRPICSSALLRPHWPTGLTLDGVKPVLQLDSVNKTYRRGDEQVRVLVDFDFTLAAGEFVVVTGPSGAGKSTLLHIAGGLDAPDSGTVAVAGQDVSATSTGARAAFRRRNLGLVFQFFNLVPMLTAVQNVSLPLVLDGMAARTADARAEELLTSRRSKPSRLA